MSHETFRRSGAAAERGKTATLEALNPEYKAARVPARRIQAFEITAHLPRVREIATE